MRNNVFDRMEVQIGDITKLAVDAIVNAANQSLKGGGGVDGAIHRAAGPQLLDECRKIGECPTGEARITRGYNLDAKYVIHTVGPVYSGKPQDAELLAACYKNSLRLAAENGVRTIAFPAISCGVYGYPINEAAKVAVEATIEFLKNNSSIEKVVFLLFSESDASVYRKIIESMQGSTGPSMQEPTG